MRKAKTITALAGVAIAALVLTGCAPAEETPAPVETSEVEETTEESTGELGSIVDVAVGAGTFTTLAAALSAAGLIETLEGEGPFTVFAPTDEAFMVLPEGVLDALLLPENAAILTQILTYHVVSGSVLAADVTTGDVPSVEGSNISIDTSAGVVLNGSANVITTDILADNGVIHVIDAVILPPGLDVFTLVG